MLKIQQRSFLGKMLMVPGIFLDHYWLLRHGHGVMAALRGALWFTGIFIYVSIKERAIARKAREIA